MRFASIALCAALAAIASTASAQTSCSRGPAALAQCGNPEFQACTLGSGPLQRQFCLHVPEQLPSPTGPQPRPVVLAFHGGGGSADRAVAWIDHLTEQDIILVAPQAISSRKGTGQPLQCTNYWRHIGRETPTWQDMALPNDCTAGPVVMNDLADVAFVEALLTEINRRVDVQGVYALGFSNGAGMVLQMMITKAMAERVDGFALISNGISKYKLDALEDDGILGLKPNLSAARPTILIHGTADKSMFAGDTVISRIDELHADGTCPDVSTPAGVIDCYMYNSMFTNETHDFKGRADLTIDWLRTLNALEPIPSEATYPDKGHANVPHELRDQTVGVRQDFETTSPDGAPVTMITVIGGNHEVPGAAGDYAPCPFQNCDFRAIDEILQFWRSHAGFVNRWE